MRKVFADEIITLAEAFIGYCEKATNAYLMDFVRNAGSGNWTRFSQELQDVKYFDYGSKIGKEWCTQFVSWLFFMATGKDIKRTKEILCVPLNELNESAGCEGIRKYFRNAGRYDAKPQIGDLILFTTVNDGKNSADHVGIISDIGSDGKIYTIEGNKDNMVTACAYPPDYWKILGYCHPIYDKMEDAELQSKYNSLKKKYDTLSAKLTNIRNIVNE